MASKETAVYIVDLGSSMADCHNGRTESDLDWSMRWVWDKITTTVAAGRKTWHVGVLGVRTDETNNLMDEEEGYENISVLQELQPMDLGKLRELQKKIIPSNTGTGDCISALVPAIEMIDAVAPQRLKFNRKIFMVTSGEAPLDLDPEDVKSIAARLRENNIQLTILGVDFDDAEFGFKEEDKTEQKAANEALLKSLVDAVGEDLGTFGTIAEAVEELDAPRLKQTQPYKSYDGPLTLGDPSVDPRALSIHVERYFKTKRAPPPSASNVVFRPNHGTQSTQTVDGDEMEGLEYGGGSEFAAVKNARTYKVNDPEAPGGKRDVEFDSLAKGYEYGRTAVHISEAEFNITKLETEKSFSIIGFIQQDKFEPFLNFGESCLIVAQKNSSADALKLSSLIHSLLELESYALARFVAKDGKDPILLLLAPNVDVDFECLYDIPLPFAEDVRQYPFPPLDKVVTVNNNVLTKHRFLPSEDLVESMSEYVDAMDISTYAIDENGERTLEYAPIDDAYSPALHRINQVVRHRAIHYDKPVPPVPPILLKYAIPDQELVNKAKSRLEDLIAVAEIKKVPPKTKGKRNRQQHKGIKPISGLDVDALLREPANKRTKIDPDNAIPSFKQMMDASEEESVFADAAKQMGDVINRLLTNNVGGINDDRAIENIGVFREYMINFEEPKLYNDFLKGFKSQLLSGALGNGGGGREFFRKLRFSKLGLIDETLSDVSKITSDDASKFWDQKYPN